MVARETPLRASAVFAAMHSLETKVRQLYLMALSIKLTLMISFHAGCEALEVLAGVACLVLEGADLELEAFLVTFFSFAAPLPLGEAEAGVAEAGAVAGAAATVDMFERWDIGLEEG